MKFIATVIALVLLASACGYADGGAILLRKQAGPFTVTVFGEPAPLRVGQADLSVMLQNTADTNTVLDAVVDLRLKRSETGRIVEIAAPATHKHATNKLLYSARVTLPSPGTWRLSVEVTRKGSPVSVDGGVNVLPEEPSRAAYWPYFALIPFVTLMFAMNQWLKRKRRISRPSARP